MGKKKIVDSDNENNEESSEHEQIKSKLIVL